MIALRPHSFSIKSTNVLEENPAAYVAGTTYSEGNYCLYSSKIYKSLVNLNLGNQPDTSTDEWAYVSDVLPLPYNAGTTYSIGAIVADLANHKLYESLQNANIGKALTLVDWWLDIGATNAYKMFDEYVNTGTEFYQEIHVKLNVNRADYITFFGLAGNTVDITLWDITETTELWTKQIDLTYGLAIIGPIDWYEYFFGEYSLQDDLSTSIGVITYDAVLEIKITYTEGVAICGMIVVGRSYKIGDTLYGVSAGMLDYSKKITDDFGRTYLAQGNWAKRNDVTVLISNNQLDAIYRLLTSLRGIATAWITDSRDDEENRLSSLLLYGYCRDFSIVVQHPNYAECRLEIEGLI